MTRNAYAILIIFFNMPYHKKSHNDWQQCLCIICFKKSKDVRVLSEKQRSLLDKHVLNGLGVPDIRLPTGLCGCCRIVLNKYENNDFSRKLPKCYDYSTITPPPYPTRSNTDKCHCTICQIATGGFNGSGREETGQFSISKVKGENEESPSCDLKLCHSCLSPIGKGRQHICSKTSFYNNVVELAGQHPGNAGDKIASKILKQKIDASHSQDKIYLSQERGRPLPVQVGHSKTEHPHVQLSHEDMAIIKMDLPLSSRKTHKLAQHLRVATKRRKLFEPRLKENISSRHHTLDTIFEANELEFGDNVVPVVSCTDLGGLIDVLNEKRNQLYDDTLAFKVGIDGGGGYLKFCVNIINPNDVFFKNVKGRQLYSDGVASKSMKCTGVNKLQIIGLAPDIPENYDNVLKMWSHLDLNSLFKAQENVRVAAGLKLCNIIIGLMSHSCNHPCTWCNISRYVF